MADNEVIIEKRLKKIYGEAHKELKKQLASFNKRYKAKDAQMRMKLRNKEITAQEYASWQKGQIFIGKQWQAKVDHAADTLLHANREAMKIVDGEKMNTFADNAIHMTKQIDQDVRLAYGFGIYSADTVAKLIKDEPELLPRKVVNGRKDKAWNRRNIANAVTQGIIQGDDIETIAKRIAEKTASTNMDAMIRYARTALTGAENAGRIESMHYAENMGIHVRKKWLATLDNRTRHSHQLLDGQVQDVDHPFHSELGSIRYPGDPEADPANVYNCRCTLTYVYPEFEDLIGIGGDSPSQRRDNLTKEVIDDVTYHEWAEQNAPTPPPVTPPVVSIPPVVPPSAIEEYTQSEKDAVESYVSGDTMWINQYLRGEDGFGELSDTEEQMLKDLDSATKKQAVKDKKLYRAVDAQAVFGKITDFDFENLRAALVYGDKSKAALTMLERVKGKIGTDVTEKGFMSTTRDPEIAYQWNGYTGSTKDIVLELSVQDGVKGFDVEKAFEVDEEQQKEVLLQRGLTYTIEGIERRGTEDGVIIVVKATIRKR